jgi:hypothetical protein
MAASFPRFQISQEPQGFSNPARFAHRHLFADRPREPRSDNPHKTFLKFDRRCHRNARNGHSMRRR